MDELFSNLFRRSDFHRQDTLMSKQKRKFGTMPDYKFNDI